MLSRDEVAGMHAQRREDMPTRASPVKTWHPAIKTPGLKTWATHALLAEQNTFVDPKDNDQV